MIVKHFDIISNQDNNISIPTTQYEHTVPEVEFSLFTQQNKLDEKLPIDLSNSNAEITYYGTKPDGHLIGNSCNIVDNKVILPVSLQMTTVDGILNGVIEIRNSNGNMRFYGINFIVMYAPETAEIPSTDEFTRLEELITQAEDYTKLKNKPQINGVELSGNLSAEQLGIVIPDVSGLATQDALNALSESFDTQIKSIASQLSVIRTSLATKADITEVYDKVTADNTFALKTEIPSIDGFATQESVDVVSGQVKLKANIADVYTKTIADNTFAKQTDIPDTSNLATKTEVELKADADSVYTKADTDSAFVKQTDFDTLNEQIEINKTSILNKQDKTTIVTDITSTETILTPLCEHEYRYGTLTSLTITLPTEINLDYITSIVFTSGETDTTLTYPDTIKWSGDDVSDGVFLPVVSKTYNIILWFDDTNLYGVVKGGDVG